MVDYLVKPPGSGSAEHLTEPAGFALCELIVELLLCEEGASNGVLKVPALTSKACFK